MSDALLEIDDLRTYFDLSEGTVRAVDGVSLTVRPGETLCVVGESGCGKSVTARSILQLVGRPGRIVGGHIRYRANADSEPVDLAALPANSSEIRRIRGNEIAMIFQEPMTALSPVHTIGHQIIETIRTHETVTKAEARERAIEELRRVGIPRPEIRVDAYAFQLSGGMRQRAMIALALACRPRLLIADEPTTALDVTTQAQILGLLCDLQDELGMAIIFITHDLGVVAEIADRVAVMYLGVVAEQGDVDSIFHAPRHPYTHALLKSLPSVERHRVHDRLPTIRGMVPHPSNRPPGCPFHTRCDVAIAGVCETTMPPELIAASDETGTRLVRCHLYEDAADLRTGSAVASLGGTT